MTVLEFLDLNRSKKTIKYLLNNFSFEIVIEILICRLQWNYVEQYIGEVLFYKLGP